MTYQADRRSLRTPGLTNVPDRLLHAIEHPTFDESPRNGRRRDGMPLPRPLLPFPPLLPFSAIPVISATPTIPAIPAIPTIPAFHP